MPQRRSKKARSIKPPRKRKKIAPKKGRSKPKTTRKKVAKRSPPKKIVRAASRTLKRGKIAKPPPGFRRVVLSEGEERSDTSDIMSKKQKIVDFANANEWRESGLPTSDELYDYLKWGSDHFGIEIGQMYRFYLGYDLED